MRSLLYHRAFGVVSFLAIVSGCGYAADNSESSAEPGQYLPWEKGDVRVGGFVAIFNSTLSFGMNNAPGVKINGEDVFGLESTLTVFRADAMIRPGSSLRHEIDVSYAGYHRDGDVTLSRELTIDGTTYPVGARVQTVFNFDIIKASYSYAFIQSDRLRIAGGLGIYAVPLKYGLNITTMNGRSNVEGANSTFPLPALELHTEFQVIPRLFVNAGIDAMYLEVSDFRGSLVDLNLGVEYRPWKHFGLGLGYGYTGVNVEGESTKSDYPGVNFVGSADVHFSGLLFYGKFSF
ncbi:MAG: hypothetical protein C5B50_07530 [Verrucomicrobia bacterium]|nr:MAG: hypothetical protein C5B50_07530 [Verrucomicrobiota bacterium]